jgi:catalase
VWKHVCGGVLRATAVELRAAAGVQLFTEEQADQFPFAALDVRKLVPEELVPSQTVGR